MSADLLCGARGRAVWRVWCALGWGESGPVRAPLPGGPCARGEVTRDELLTAMIHARREEPRLLGALTPGECTAWAARDLTYGREITEPRLGRAMGINAAGALLIAEPDGTTFAARSGSLVLAAPDPPRLP